MINTNGEVKLPDNNRGVNSVNGIPAHGASHVDMTETAAIAKMRAIKESLSTTADVTNGTSPSASSELIIAASDLVEAPHGLSSVNSTPLLFNDTEIISALFNATSIAPMTTSAVTVSDMSGDNSTDEISTTPRSVNSLGLIAVIVLTILGNASICLSVKIVKKLQHMPYFFLVSMSLLHILMASILMPPAIIVLYEGE